MIYLDYSATTPVRKDVLDSFSKACMEYIGNPNSLHKLGVASNHLIEQATQQIKDILKLTHHEVIYTSGSSESNNLAIKGVAEKYQNRGKHIITTELEHSSIYGPLTYLSNHGFEIDFVPLDSHGQVDLQALKELLRDDTILVSIASVNSEIGILQPIAEIASILKNYPKCIFHCDMTQSIGKVEVPLENVDLISFSAHKFYGMKGIGVLLRNEKISLEPLIHGGKSTSIYRSGTPALPLIVSLSKALRLIYEDFEHKLDHVTMIRNDILEQLKTYSKVVINSNSYCIPHVVNISVLGVKPETLLHALEEDDIYISTQSACSSSNTRSKAVYALTHDEASASSSIRISLSYLTTKEEIDSFLSSFARCYQQLTIEDC